MKVKSSLAILTIILGTSLFYAPSADAVNTGPVQVTCSNGTFGTGWDNSNQYFANVGNIAAHYCQLVHNSEYISDNLTDGSLRWYNGVAPEPEPEPEPEAPPTEDTSTAVVDTPTVIVDTPTVIVDTPTVIVDTSTTIVDTITVVDTSTATQETVTVIVEPVPVAPVPPPQPPIVIPDPPPAVIPDPPPAVEPEPPVVEPEPPVEEPEPPVVEPEPPTPVEEPPVEAEEPPVDAEEPPVVEEEPPALAEEPPLVADKNSTDEEKELVAEALIEAADGEAVTAEAIAEAGLTYADLPPETPVEVRVDANGNQVIITAEVAAALVVLANPAELINAIFNDPTQALLALENIGADMSLQEREESEQTIVAAVIVGGIATQSALTTAAGAIAYRRKP